MFLQTKNFVEISRQGITIEYVEISKHTLGIFKHNLAYSDKFRHAMGFKPTTT